MQHAREQLAHTALVNAEAASHSPMSSGAVQCSHWNFYCQQMYILQPCHASQKLRVPNWHRKSDRHSYRDVREPAFNLIWGGKTPLRVAICSSQ